MEEVRGWLHFVGHKYYKTPAAFSREAQRVGVTRRIDPRVLKKMRFGDIVVCAFKKPDEKSTVAFGEFRVVGVSGIDQAVTEELRQQGKVKECVNFGGAVVQRGCGSYVQGATYSTTATLSEIAELAEKAKCPVMVLGGSWQEYEMPVRFKSLPFQMGFRRFDLAAFKAAVADGKALVRGQFYVKEEISAEGMQTVGEVLAQQVENYLRA